MPLLQISKGAFGESVRWCADCSPPELSAALRPQHPCSESEAGTIQGYGQGLLQGYPQHEPVGAQLLHSNCLFLAATAFPAYTKVRCITEGSLIYWVAGKKPLLGVVRATTSTPHFPFRSLLHKKVRAPTAIYIHC